MLRKVHETIKPQYPDVKIVAGATVPIAHGFFKGIFEQGAMPYLDAVSVHPYLPLQMRLPLKYQDYAS